MPEARRAAHVVIIACYIFASIAAAKIIVGWLFWSAYPHAWTVLLAPLETDEERVLLVAAFGAAAVGVARAIRYIIGRG
jgi:hypothetical protein